MPPAADNPTVRPVTSSNIRDALCPPGVWGDRIKATTEHLEVRAAQKRGAPAVNRGATSLRSDATGKEGITMMPDHCDTPTRGASNGRDPRDWELVPAGPSRDRILELRGDGHTLGAIIRATRVTSIWEIAHGRYEQVTRRTEQAILAVTPESLADAHRTCRVIHMDTLEDLAAARVGLHPAAERLGVQAASIYTACCRAGRPDLYRRLTALDSGWHTPRRTA